MVNNISSVTGRFARNMSIMLPSTLRNIPEELLRDILDYVLYRPTESFLGNEPTDHTADHNLGNSSQSLVLTVCKQWRRVGMPLLYASLRIACSEQAETVAKVLQKDTRLGQAVRDLRLDGGYSKDLYTIVKLVTKLRGLYVNTQISASESLLGFRLALPILKPKILYINSLCERRKPRNIKQTQLDSLLESLIRESASLVSLSGLRH